MDPVLPINPKIKITEHVQSFEDTTRRPIAMAALGTVYRGAALPHVDLSDPLTAEAGVRKRFVMEPPEPDVEWIRELKEFTADYVNLNYLPLAPDVDLSVDRWLDNTAYPEWRKQELRACWVKCGGDALQKQYLIVKSFIKDECYPAFKHARAINARSDEFKCWFGPIVKHIEEIVYKDPSFIKHVPVAKRPDYIMKRLYQEGGQYLATDYSSFEALFRAEIMQAVEFVLYRHMTKHLPIAKLIDEVLDEVLAGENRCEFKWFVVKCLARRMSGEMCTSLGNGFSNLMFMLFMCKKLHCRDVSGVVEGDDGLFRATGNLPTTSDFAKLGLIIKLQKHNNLAHASFCGIVFEPGDNVNIRDPINVVVNFGWGDAKYAFSSDKKKQVILRCKALSYAHQYPGAPIIQSLAHAVLRNTRKVAGMTKRYVERARFIDSWHREKILEAIRDEAKIVAIEVPVNTRLLAAELYGVSVEHQKILEVYYDSLADLNMYSHPIMDLYLQPAWVRYWDSYVLPRQPDPMRPAHTWNRMPGWRPEFETKFFVT